MLSSLVRVSFVVLLATVGTASALWRIPPVPQEQPSVATPPLVFDGVTVIDVKRGERLPDQRVIIVDARIQTMGSVHTVPLPAGAQVIDARRKYLIPGLWDMHTHSDRKTDVFYPLFIANGVTGIRDARSKVPLDTLRMWRREILKGTLVGPPRQLLAGPAIDEQAFLRDVIQDFHDCSDARVQGQGHICVTDSKDARRVVDSLQAAGADFIKTYLLSREMYFVIAAEARRVKIPVGGHVGFPGKWFNGSTIEASDSGASIEDHHNSAGDLWSRCLAMTTTDFWDAASMAKCQPVAESFRHNGTWWVPTLTAMATADSEASMLKADGDPFAIPFGPTAQRIINRLIEVSSAFWGGARLPHPWLRDSATTDHRTRSSNPSAKFLSLVRQVGLPILAGTDVNPEETKLQTPGFSLHAELALYVAEGLTPLAALQSATLNPAIYLKATDSLGTVAPGKLADLVILDADPLADITNTTTIRAVVANGRYYDRTALDHLVAMAQAASNAHR